MVKLLCIIVLVISVYGDYAPSIRNDHELDQFILRTARRCNLDIPGSLYSQPMHADEILGFLRKLDSLDIAGMLTKQESFRLHKITALISGQRHIYAFKKEKIETENYVNLNLWGDIKPYYQHQADVHLKGLINPRMSGASGHLSYFTEVSAWTEYRSDTVFPISSYQPFDGNPYNLSGGRVKSSSTRSSDIFRGGVSYKKRMIGLETAVDYLRLGPAVFNPLTLSGNGAPLTYFRANLDLSAFTYVHAFGQLRAQKDKAKYFYMHRLDFELFRTKVHFGLNELVINGSTAEKAQTDSLEEDIYGELRDWEWMYMIPFIPYSFAEHYGGDRDNKVISFDLAVNLPQRFRWYMEMFLDDISSPLTLFNDDFGNKWALTAGGQFFGTLCARDIDLTLEYCHIEPWVYTHFHGGSQSYTHFGQSLGAETGPNSDVFIFSGRYAVGIRNSIGLFFNNTRKGTDRGSSITDVFQKSGSSHPDSEKKHFLSHPYHRLSTIGLFWNLMPFELLSITSEVTFDNKKKLGAHVYGGFSF